MAEANNSPEWYYVGHYGQLGPLTLEQMDDLVADGVVDQETYVWKVGMADWSPASQVVDLAARFKDSSPPPGPYGNQPEPPMFDPNRASSGLGQGTSPENQYGVHRPYGNVTINNYLNTPKSDKSRVAAGVLNIIPGFGRFYLGYAAHGVLQLLTAFCGVGVLWSWLDGLFILAGGLKYDGYGRTLDE